MRSWTILVLALCFVLAACSDNATLTTDSVVARVALTPDAFMQNALSTAQTSNTQQAGIITQQAGTIVTLSQVTPPRATPLPMPTPKPTNPPAQQIPIIPTAIPATAVPVTGPFIARAWRIEKAISNDVPKPGNIFLVVGFQLSNITDKNFNVTTYDFKLRASDGYDYNASSSTYLLARGVSGRTLAPKQDVSGEMAFEVPENAKPVSLTFDSSEENYTAPIK